MLFLAYFPMIISLCFSLLDIYDSITWKVSNLDGSLKNI